MRLWSTKGRIHSKYRMMKMILVLKQGLQSLLPTQKELILRDQLRKTILVKVSKGANSTQAQIRMKINQATLFLVDLKK